MLRPPRLDTEGAASHVIARGNERNSLLQKDGDRETYLGLLGDTCGMHHARILGYCMTPNHASLALQTGPVAIPLLVAWLKPDLRAWFGRLP